MDGKQQTDNSQTNSQQAGSQVVAEALDAPSTGEGGNNLLSKDKTKTSSALAEVLSSAQGKSISTGLLTALVVVLLIFLAITPAFSSITSQLDKNEQLRNIISRQNEKLTSLATIQGKEQQSATELQEFSEILSTDKQQAAIYQELYQSTQRAGVEFESVRFDEITNRIVEYEELPLPERLEFQRVRLVVRGSISNAMDLLDGIENNQRGYVVEDFSITSPDSGVGQSNQLAFDITLRTIYWQELE